MKNIKLIEDDLIKETLLNLIQINNCHYNAFSKYHNLYILNDQYVFRTNNDSFIFVNKQGLHSRLDGPAVIYDRPFPSIYFWINNCLYNENEFAEKTNQLVCIYCDNFCNQRCFI